MRTKAVANDSRKKKQCAIPSIAASIVAAKKVFRKAVNGYPRSGYPLIEAGTNSQITRISGSTNMYFRKKMEKKIF